MCFSTTVMSAKVLFQFRSVFQCSSAVMGCRSLCGYTLAHVFSAHLVLSV